MPIYPPMAVLSGTVQRGIARCGFPSRHIGGMSRIEYSWQVALQQSLRPLPRSSQPTRAVHVRSVSDPPAGPCVFVDCAREFRLPIHPTVCFKVGRFTLTQSSWTASRRCSRKWMSGHAATALVLLKDRGLFRTLAIRSLGEPTPPGSRGISVSP
jgi:hypothetical protein